MTKQFSRVMRQRTYISIAKHIRDAPISQAARIAVVNAVHKALKEDNPMYNEVMFKAIATGGLNADEV